MIIVDFPNDIIREIRKYVRPCDLFECNSWYFSNLYGEKRRLIMDRDAYVRFMIRNDMYYVFGLYVQNNSSIYGRRSIYEYGNAKYRSFIKFMNDYCIQNQSQRCREIIHPIIANL